MQQEVLCHGQSSSLPDDLLVQNPSSHRKLGLKMGSLAEKVMLGDKAVKPKDKPRNRSLVLWELGSPDQGESDKSMIR